MKLGQLVEYNEKNIFLQKSSRENEIERLVPDLFLFFQKDLYKVMPTGHHPSFNIFW